MATPPTGIVAIGYTPQRPASRGPMEHITISIAITPKNANSHAIHGATSQAARAAVILGEQPTVTTGNKFNDAANGQVELDEHGAQGPLH